MLRRALREYGACFHCERNHPGLGNVLIEPPPASCEYRHGHRWFVVLGSVDCSTTMSDLPRVVGVFKRYGQHHERFSGRCHEATPTSDSHCRIAARSVSPLNLPLASTTNSFISFPERSARPCLNPAFRNKPTRRSSARIKPYSSAMFGFSSLATRSSSTAIPKRQPSI